jgi:type IV pilus assembly protein PilV
MSAPSHCRQGRSAARGVTMIEALVALVVLSLGMLGIATLYLTTLHAARSAISRMQAVNLVTDLADRIRANRTAGAAYAGAAANNNCVGGAIGAVTCTPAQMAANDLFQWQAQLTAAGMLTGAPVGAVTFVAGTPATYTISLTWQEPGEPAPLSYTVNFQL